MVEFTSTMSSIVMVVVLLNGDLVRVNVALWRGGVVLVS